MKELALFKDLDLEDIYEEISSKWQLGEAFKKVKANKGSPGMDGQTIEWFKENQEAEIRKLSEELINWTYKPKAVKRVEIPKAGKGTRKLGIATVRDRIVQESIKISIEWKIDEEFSESSYGFRAGKNQHQAILKAQEYVKEGKEIIVDIDLEKFFDKIPQNRLMSKVSKLIKDKRVVKLIGMTIRSGVLENGKIIKSDKGVPQGSPISPLLSNIILDELDKELEKRKLSFCRYADDCNIFCKTERAGKRVMKSITKYIEGRMKLKVNEEKSKVARSEEVTFLGMTIVEGKIAISKKAMKKAFEKLIELIPRNTAKPMETAIKEINRWIRGWFEYFKLTNYPIQIKHVESHIRRRLRARIVKQKKRKRYLVKAILKRGIRKATAYKSVYGRRGIWAVSWSSAMHRAYPNRWFKAKGLAMFSESRLPHWLSLKKWVLLP